MKADPQTQLTVFASKIYLMNLFYVFREKEKVFVRDQKLEGQDLRQALMFFARHSYRDIKRKKCHFCLAFCSVFFVVLFTLVINTIVARGPIIFLKLVEDNEG